ncbi:MAG: hypothetical protein AAFV96_01730 [Pseudomonadota bacterium]
MTTGARAGIPSGTQGSARSVMAAKARKMVDPALVAGDLATLVAGRLALPAARTRPSAFVFRGVAIGDFAVAALAYRRAVEASAGVPLPGW